MKTQTALALLLSLPLCTLAMERPIQRSRSMEQIHSIQENKSEAQKERANLARLALQPLQVIIPVAPAIKPAAKQPTPPAPEKPQKSFLEKHKKAIVLGSVGAAGIVTAGIIWKLASQEDLPQPIVVPRVRINPAQNLHSIR